MPLLASSGLLGVLYVESPNESRFTHEDEDALLILASHLSLRIELSSALRDSREAPPIVAPDRVKVHGEPVEIRYFRAESIVFVDGEYLIKGVAGAIIWRLLNEYVDKARTDFSNRELRRDPSLRLPDVTDNLEARLILLARRLAERCPFLAIEKLGRGRFRLLVTRPVELVEVTA